MSTLWDARVESEQEVRSPKRKVRDDRDEIEDASVGVCRVASVGEDRGRWYGDKIEDTSVGAC